MKLSLKRIYYDRAEVKAALDARAMANSFVRLGSKSPADGPKAHLQLSEPTSLVAERGQSRDVWSLWTDVAKSFLGEVNFQAMFLPHQDAA